MPYHHLTRSERLVIDSMRCAGYSLRRIAWALGRSPSSISRELRRNRGSDSRYNPYLANIYYWDRRKRCVPRSKTGNAKLMAYVRRKLSEAWSPEQIAGRLRYIEYPTKRSMWISHETIYRYVWADKARGGAMYKDLRRGKKKYGKRGGGRHPNTWIRGRVSIEQRPSIVARQERYGDWEGDTVHGRHRNGCLATLVERKSLYLCAFPMPDATAQSLNAAVIKAFEEIPCEFIHTLTVDNGKEFARFKCLEEHLQADVYFTHPYSAWERPINENTNGLLRQFLPKKFELRFLSVQALRKIVRSLNNRPRKKLGYRTPHEVFQQLAVALDG